jgi:Fe-S-cluster containining protein
MVTNKCIVLGCSECCRLGQVIRLTPDEIEKYPEYNRRTKAIGPDVFQYLAVDESGDCIYLEHGRCSIYEGRPALCRALKPGSLACTGIREAARKTVLNGDQ